MILSRASAKRHNTLVMLAATRSQGSTTDTLQCTVLPVIFLDIVFCIFTSKTRPSVSPGSGDKKRKAMTPGLKLKITTQLYVNLSVLITFKVG